MKLARNGPNDVPMFTLTEKIKQAQNRIITLEMSMDRCHTLVQRGAIKERIAEAKEHLIKLREEQHASAISQRE